LNGSTQYNIKKEKKATGPQDAYSHDQNEQEHPTRTKTSNNVYIA